MHTGKVVIFDGDDTLWTVEPLYDAALDRAQAIVAENGLPGGEWRIVQRELDLRNVRRMGMSAERFPLSSQQALLEVARRHDVTASTQLTAAVVNAARSVFEMQAPVIDGAKDTLEALTPHFHLALLTKGDQRIQRKRIEDSGLAKFFERVEVVDEKTEQSFSRLVTVFDASPHQCWSVGNSLASDLNPALRAGLNAIWIDAHVWEHERRESTPVNRRLIALDNLQQVVDVLLRETPVGYHS